MVENTFWNLGELVQDNTGHHGAKTEDCHRHCVYMCGVLQHTKDTPGWGRQDTNPKMM